MRSLTSGEVRAVINALTEEYVKGRNDGNWHIFTFTLRSTGETIRGRFVTFEDGNVVVGRDDRENTQVSVAPDDVLKLLIEAE